MSRPRTYAEDRVTTRVALPPELHEQLGVAARDRGLSANALAVLALTDFLRRLIPVEELELVRPPDDRQPRP